MGGQRGDAEARAEVERGGVGQWHGVALGEDDELLRSAVSTSPGGFPDPDPLTVAIRVDPGSDRIDCSCAVLVRYDLGKRERLAGPAAAPCLPVRRVDAGAVQTDPYLAPTRLRDRAIGQVQDVRITGDRMHDCLHSRFKSCHRCLYSRLYEVFTGAGDPGRTGRGSGQASASARHSYPDVRSVHRWSDVRYAWSRISVLPAARAQWAQQKNCPLVWAPCPEIFTPQWSQIGAIAWIAHSKLSKMCTAPWACTSKLIS